MNSNEFYERIDRVRAELNELGKHLGLPDDDEPLSDVDRLAIAPKSEIERKLKNA